MSVVVRSFPVMISFLLLSAHWLRSYQFVLTAVCLLAPFLLLVPRAWAARAIQAALAVAAVEWVRTIVVIARERMATGQPFLRMAAILGAVVLFTLGSAFTFCLPAMRLRYGLATPESAEGESVVP